MFMTECRVPLIARSWDPVSGEVETQGGNGRAREGEREREREKGREKSVAFVCKKIKINHKNYTLPLKRLVYCIAIIDKSRTYALRGNNSE